ncbi:hypothetical protein ACWFRC_20795 [Bacillus cereus]
MKHKVAKHCNQILMSKFLILYSLLGVIEPVIKEKRQVEILTKSLFHNKRKRAYI